MPTIWRRAHPLGDELTLHVLVVGRVGAEEPQLTRTVAQAQAELDASGAYQAWATYSGDSSSLTMKQAPSSVSCVSARFRQMRSTHPIASGSTQLPGFSCMTADRTDDGTRGRGATSDDRIMSDR